MSENISISDGETKGANAGNEPKPYSVVKANPSRKRVTAGRRRAPNRIPDEILNNEDLAADMAVLPSNYNFEVLIPNLPRKIAKFLHTITLMTYTILMKIYLFAAYIDT